MSTKVNKNLKKRTIGEDLWLIRQSRGLKQGEMAAEYGVCETNYTRMELDKMLPTEAICPDKDAMMKIATLPLLLALARRRARWTLLYAAKRIGMSHVTLLLRERSGDAGLKAWWNKEGWKF